MEVIRSVILSACFIGIISAAMEMIATSEKAEGQIRLILGAVFTIITVSGFAKADISLDIDSYSAYAETASYRTDEYYIAAAEKNLARTLRGCLEEKGIFTREVLPNINISESGSIYINRVTVKLTSSSDSGSAERLLKELLGEDTEISISCGEEEQR